MKRYFIICNIAAISISATNAQSVLTGDAYVYNSLCVGMDCVVPEGFGFATIILKENNTQIRFEDSSTPGGSFASTDWSIGANESPSGGKNLFYIDDLTAMQRIVSIAGGAPTNSLFIDPTGKIGLKTGMPEVELHLNDMDSPTIRLQQNGNGGYTPYTWDLVGNEANFFIRDLNTGALPFRIRPGAASNSIFVNASGNVSLGAANEVADTNSRRLYVNGNMAVNGNVTLLSDRRVKTHIEDLNYGLASILKLSPKKYEYVQDSNYDLDLAQGTQIGLIAQEVEAIIPEIVKNDFQVADAQGQLTNMKGIDYVELVPVLVKAIQEQQVLIEKQGAEITEMKSRMAAMDQWIDKVLNEVWK